MIKKDVFNGDVKAQLKAAANDRLHRFMMADGMMRGAVVNGTRMVKEMQANHELGGMETLVLGQAYIAAALLTANLKAKDRISIHIQCSGPIKGLDVESNVFGEVRGCLKNNTFSLETVSTDGGLSTFFGAGFLTVTKYLEEARKPFAGQVMLEFGTLAQDLANYFVQSEQTPSAFNLSVYFDAHGRVEGAGGLFLQAMPGAGDAVIADAEQVVAGLPSLGQAFAGGMGVQTLIMGHFEEMMPIFLGNHRVEFFCRCTRDLMRGYLAQLPARDIDDILENGPFPLELRCHNCNTTYDFSHADLLELRR